MQLYVASSLTLKNFMKQLSSQRRVFGGKKVLAAQLYVWRTNGTQTILQNQTRSTLIPQELHTARTKAHLLTLPPALPITIAPNPWANFTPTGAGAAPTTNKHTQNGIQITNIRQMTPIQSLATWKVILPATGLFCCALASLWLFAVLWWVLDCLESEL